MKNLQLVVVVFVLSIFSLQLSAQDIVQSKWQKHLGKGHIAIPFDVNKKHGDIRVYDLATIPGINDSKWIPIEGDINIEINNSTVKCFEEADFTYFQTIVDVPANTTINTFSITFGQIDDGARAYVFNSKYPKGTYQPGSEFRLGATTNSVADFHTKIVAGEANRIVIVQFDDCARGNTIKHARLKINGETQAISTKTVEEIPMVAMPALIGHWTFDSDSLLDLTGNFAPLTRHGDVQVIDGKLKVGNNAYATSKKYTGIAFKEKTLVAWAKIDNPNSGGGSILTVGKPTSNFDFDAIVYAERQAKTWMAGSGWFHRTQDLGSKAQETTPNNVVKIAITYGDNNGNADVKIYRNGELVGAYTKGKMLNWTAGQTGVLFGLRHFFNGLPGKPFVEASIEEARIYSGVLTPEQIKALKAN
ncbi:MAG: LamG-like jellyroll fold domain-containing protein [Saprospiraceae bacterium]